MQMRKHLDVFTNLVLKWNVLENKRSLMMLSPQKILAGHTTVKSQFLNKQGPSILLGPSVCEALVISTKEGSQL